MENDIENVAMPMAMAGNMPQQPMFEQSGSDNMMIPNYGTINITVPQMPNIIQAGTMPQMMPGGFYVPLHIDREYYNIFVLGMEEFDKPYVKVPRERCLRDYMLDDTKSLFEAMTPEICERIKILPSLFMAENRTYGRAEPEQKVIYGFVSDIKIYDNDVKFYYCGYKNDILQCRINELLEELGLAGNRHFNELNRTHWSIKRVDLIQELYEAGIQVPVFNIQSSL